MSLAIVFPGQGSQKIGMCTSFFTGFKSGIEMMEEIEDAVSMKLSDLINEGPPEELVKTQNSQIAIFAASMCCFTVLEKEFGLTTRRHAKYFAGHSLGEYTALCASGVIPLADAARLVRFRGQIMANSYKGADAVMVAVLGSTIEIVERILDEYHNDDGVCVIANDNSPAQVVLSGTESAVNDVSKMALEEGAKKVMKLSTSGPFHSPLMAHAAIALDDYLKQNIEFKAPNVPIIMNVLAEPVNDPDQFNDLLVRQMTERVRWRESIQYMTDNNVNEIIEIGPGKVLTGMLKRYRSDIYSKSVENLVDMDEFAKLYLARVV